MSSTLHAVVFAPSLIAAGNLPDRTPDHQVELLTGKILRICGSRTNPVSGRVVISSCIALTPSGLIAMQILLRVRILLWAENVPISGHWYAIYF